MHAKGSRKRNETDHGLQRAREEEKKDLDLDIYLLFVCLKRRRSSSNVSNNLKRNVCVYFVSHNIY
jgi:hypothetical protein